MAKDDAIRITDTIAFIRGANVPVVHQPKRAVIADALRDRNVAGRIPTTISPAMSQGSNYAISGRDQVQEHRHYRRAMILIRAVLMGQDRNFAAGEVARIADANLPAALGGDLDQVTTTLQDLATKVALLKTNPIAFLTANSLQVTGVDTSAPMAYAFYFDTLSNVYNFAPVPTVATWALVVENVYHVHVQQYAALAKTDRVGGGQHINVSGNVVAGAGADLMLTTQLTGCAVVYYLNGATLVAAHVQPSGGTIAETMCTNLRAGARLSSAPGSAVTGVFGAQTSKGVDPNNYVKGGFYNYCVGVRDGGAWDLYAQQRPRSYGNAVGTAIVAWKIT
ncbi:MAG: hypothetical protein ACT4P7_02550 [Gemmatimonadaceae bacterium]